MSDQDDQKPPIVTITFDGPKFTEEMLAQFKRGWAEAVARGRHHPIVLPPREEWVLVKGWLDSGTIEGVFGPYTEEHADWLLRELLELSSYNWTKAKLSTGPEG